MNNEHPPEPLDFFIWTVEVRIYCFVFGGFVWILCDVGVDLVDQMCD